MDRTPAQFATRRTQLSRNSKFAACPLVRVVERPRARALSIKRQSFNRYHQTAGQVRTECPQHAARCLRRQVVKPTVQLRAVSMGFGAETRQFLVEVARVLPAAVEDPGLRTDGSEQRAQPLVLSGVGWRRTPGAQSDPQLVCGNPITGGVERAAGGQMACHDRQNPAPPGPDGYQLTGHAWRR